MIGCMFFINCVDPEAILCVSVLPPIFPIPFRVSLKLGPYGLSPGNPT